MKVCAGGGSATFDVNITSGSTTTVHPTCIQTDYATLSPGTYTVSEVNVPTGWNFPGAGGALNNGWTAPGQVKCSDTQNNSVTLKAGDSKVCLVLNVADACIPAFGTAPSTFTPVTRSVQAPVAPANVSVPSRSTGMPVRTTAPAPTIQPPAPRSAPPARRR
jgi:hypothetical protein